MEKIKHNHCLTDILKVCLFSLLMLAPLLASVSQMLYVTFNKNAKDSYSEQIETTYTQVTNYNQIEKGKTYQFDDSIQVTNTLARVDIQLIHAYTSSPSLLSFVENINNNSTIFNMFNVYESSGTYGIALFSTDTSVISNQYVANPRALTFNFVLDGYTGNISNIFSNLKLIEEKNVNSLDNAFYYGVDKMTQSDLFNWTQNTGIYTGVHAMTNGIGIDSIFIPMLLTYWLVLTIVYIIIDVVIETFKYLTHLLQNKVKSKTS